MSSKVVFGNAHVEGTSRWGWFIGHFIAPNDLRSTPTLEVKWGVHQAGEGRSQWGTNTEATTLSILIKGQFRLQFPDQEFLLSREGDYLLWAPGVPHCWSAESDCIIVTVRWPSKPGDSVGMPPQVEVSDTKSGSDI